mgnify:CR=1|jgi:hypothetical protein
MPAHIKSAIARIVANTSGRWAYAAGHMARYLLVRTPNCATYTQRGGSFRTKLTLYDVVEFCYYPNTSGCPITVDK